MPPGHLYQLCGACPALQPKHRARSGWSSCHTSAWGFNLHQLFPDRSSKCPGPALHAPRGGWLRQCLKVLSATPYRLAPWWCWSACLGHTTPTQPHTLSEDKLSMATHLSPLLLCSSVGRGGQFCSSHRGWVLLEHDPQYFPHSQPLSGSNTMPEIF